MTKFRILGTVLAVAVAAFSVSCDKESLPEGVQASNPTIGDGETSAIIVDAIIDEGIAGYTLTYGDESYSTDLSYGEKSSAFNMNTGSNKMVITTNDTESGQEVEIFNEDFTMEDEKLYMFVVNYNEEGATYQVDVVEYSTEDFMITDEESIEYQITGNSDDYYVVNGYNYAYGFEDGQLVADINYTTGGSSNVQQVAFGEYGSTTSFGINKDGYYTNYDISYLADEDTEFLQGEYTQSLVSNSSLNNLSYDFDSNANNNELVNMFVVGDENNVDMFFLDMSDINIDYTSLNVE
jgi:hypothetical protein